MNDLIEPQTDREILLAFWKDWKDFKTCDWVVFKMHHEELRKTIYGGNGDAVGLVSDHLALKASFMDLRKIANWLAGGILSAIGLLILGIFTNRIELIFH